MSHRPRGARSGLGRGACFGEEHHIRKAARAVEIATHISSSGSMEQGKPFSATESPLVDFDAVCQKVRAAVEPARTHAVSLHDEHGDVLWLSESSMGPDEHNAVREAVEAFSDGAGPPVLAYDLGDSRSAVLFRAVNARRIMVGAIMIVTDARNIKQDARGPAKLMTPKLQRALTNFAEMRPGGEPSRDTGASARVALAPTRDSAASARLAAPSMVPSTTASVRFGDKPAQ